MQREKLIELISNWENFPLVIAHIKNNPIDIPVLIEVATDDSVYENWRVMYLIDKIHDVQAESVIPHFDVLTDFVLSTKNSSKKRHILKLLSMHEPDKKRIVELLDFCIKEFTNPAEPVAVRVHAMQILYNISLIENDFAGELISIIEHEKENHGSAGITSRGNKILKKLYSNIRLSD